MIHASNTLKTLMAFAAGLLVLACTPTVIPELSLSDLAVNFEAAGSLEKTISVTSNVDWTVSCPDAWVTVSPAAGTGNDQIVFFITDYSFSLLQIKRFSIDIGEQGIISEFFKTNELIIQVFDIMMKIAIIIIEFTEHLISAVV